MKILITGGCGFLGHHMVEHFLKNTNWDIVVMDKLTYASNGFDRLRDIDAYDDKRVTVFTADFEKGVTSGFFAETEGTNYILHLGAETHVDNSIKDPMRFVMANVVGTANILEFARGLKKSLLKMIYFSTDEVFGPAPAGYDYKEDDRYNSTNPYAATKAGGEELCMAYANTYDLPIVVTHCMNLFGERQHPEKFIPMCINKILDGEEITIHADKTQTIPGSRFYIHCRNVAQAIHFLLESGEQRGKYNIVGEKEVSNLDMAKLIADILGKKLCFKLVDFHSSRPGHDLRYALNGEKLRNMGWSIPVDFARSLENTVRWFMANPKWLGRKKENKG